MTVLEAMDFTDRLDMMELRHWPDQTSKRKRNEAAVAALFTRVRTDQAEVMLKIIERTGTWHPSGFLRMARHEGILDSNYFKSLYCCAEVWDHQHGCWIPLEEVA